MRLGQSKLWQPEGNLVAMAQGTVAQDVFSKVAVVLDLNLSPKLSYWRLSSQCSNAQRWGLGELLWPHEWINSIIDSWLNICRESNFVKNTSSCLVFQRSCGEQLCFIMYFLPWYTASSPETTEARVCTKPSQAMTQNRAFPLEADFLEPFVTVTERWLTERFLFFRMYMHMNVYM